MEWCCYQPYISEAWKPFFVEYAAAVLENVFGVLASFDTPVNKEGFIRFLKGLARCGPASTRCAIVYEGDLDRALVERSVGCEVASGAEVFGGWAAQGVLLVNMIVDGAESSQRSLRIWTPFIYTLLKYLNLRNNFAVFCWVRSQEKKMSTLVPKSNLYVSGVSFADRGDRYRFCEHNPCYRICDEFFKKKGLSPIAWGHMHELG